MLTPGKIKTLVTVAKKARGAADDAAGMISRAGRVAKKVPGANAGARGELVKVKQALKRATGHEREQLRQKAVELQGGLDKARGVAKPGAPAVAGAATEVTALKRKIMQLEGGLDDLPPGSAEFKQVQKELAAAQARLKTLKAG